MYYNEQLANKIREALMNENLEEKIMFQGLCFMVNEKMCIAVRGDEMLCRIGFERAEEELEKGNCRAMIHNNKTMKGYVFVDENHYKNKKDFDKWIRLSLDFNKVAKSSKRKK